MPLAKSPEGKSRCLMTTINEIKNTVGDCIRHKGWIIRTWNSTLVHFRSDKVIAIMIYRQSKTDSEVMRN